MRKEKAFRKSDILRFALLPGIKPRIAELVGHGFNFVPYLIATIFQSVRLLPTGHPYLNTDNMGRYGMRHVIAEAANNLVLDKRNLDQIIVFSMIILAVILVLMQIIMVFVSLFMQPSFAAPFPSNFAEFFIPGAYPPSATPGGAPQDIALILLDMVFGVPEMFESCVDQSVDVACTSTTGTPILMSTDAADFIANGGPSIGTDEPQITHWAEWPYPIHDGIHQLFAVYSYGLLIIAMLITIYFIFVVIAETAQTGTAFGKRFNKVWVPLRIVVAFGLLVPLTLGLNSGQYIVLYAAKFGTGFASNGWAYFNAQVATNYSDSMGALVSVPNQPEFAGLAQFFTVAATCKALYMIQEDFEEDNTAPRHIVAYLIRNQTESPNHLPVTNATVAGPDIPSSDDINGVVPYSTLVNGTSSFYYKANRMIVRFGHRSETAYDDYLGNVKPICGEVVISLQDSRPHGEAEPGPEIIQRYYWWLVKALWFSEGRLDTTVAPAPNEYHIYFACTALNSVDISATPGPAPTPCPSTAVQPPEEFASNLLEALNTQFRDVLMNDGGPDPEFDIGAVPAQRASGSWEIPTEMREKGWAGAAIWYNRIAEMNGAVTAATFAIPMPSLYPEVMEFVKRQKQQQEMQTSGPEIYTPVIGGTNEIDFNRDIEFQYAQGMNSAYKYWTSQSSAASTQVQPSGNFLIDTINFIFGTNGMFDMRKNADVNPLAQLVGLGRSMIETSIRNIGYMAVGTTIGAAAAAFEGLEAIGALANTLSGFFVTAATVSMTAGFVLYYILPFLPFIYFFFAVSGWIKGIFEAMVGVPLWALAHIRIDGEGLSGQAALSGYFLILEIFLRPILTLFGFIGSILIFSAMVQTLNDIFDLVVANVGGFDMHEEINQTAGTGIEYMNYYRGTIDELFFTLIYVMIVFMIGQSCFKLVDQVPNNILRWMNQNVSSFNDNRADATQGLMQTAQVGAQQATQKLGGGLQKISGYLTS